MSHTFIEVSINGVVEKELWKRIERFHYRAEELNRFRSEINWGHFTSNVDRSDTKGPIISGSLPDKYVLEALYRRFRFFILEKEKANYRRLIKVLGSAVTDETARLFYKQERKEFLKTDIVDFAFISHEPRYSGDEILNLWFNAVYFHDEEEKIEKLVELENLISKNGAEVTLLHIVWDACNKIRNLNWLLTETSQNNAKIKVPISCSI